MKTVGKGMKINVSQSGRPLKLTYSIFGPKRTKQSILIIFKVLLQKGGEYMKNTVIFLQ